MRTAIAFLSLLFCLAATASAQVKILKATQQKTFGGIGGIFMNYYVTLKPKKGGTLQVDSVKTIADTAEVRFALMKKDQGTYQLSFGYSLQPPPRCATCPDTTPKPPNLTKGVIVYYRVGEKRSSFKMKKFRQLPDLMAP